MIDVCLMERFEKDSTNEYLLIFYIQPAVSRQIRLLEDDLGITLFERERHGMSLTGPGKALVEYGRRIMLEIDRARTELQGAEAGVSGLVTVGLLPSAGEFLSSLLVTAVGRKYPGVRVRIAMGYAGTLLRWLEAGEVDATLLYGAERSAEIRTVPLVDEPLWVVGPRGSGLQPGKPVPLSIVSGWKLILPSAPHGIRIMVEHAAGLPANRSTGRHIRGVVDILLEEMHRVIKAGGWPEGHWLADEKPG